jgi:hypothetical protein
MLLSHAARKLTLTAHVSTSVGWFGALAVFLAHAAAGAITEDLQTVRATALAMTLTAWFVILPLCIGSLVTGAVQAAGTAWGLVRHYWVCFKLALTVVATVILLLKLGPIDQLAEAARGATFGAGDLIGARISLVVHALGGLLILLVVMTLAIYKPRGLTRFGRGAAPQSGVSTPRWVKMSAAALLALTLVLLVMVFAGNHGPGAHL